jgi:hypothetical protein
MKTKYVVDHRPPTPSLSRDRATVKISLVFNGSKSPHPFLWESVRVRELSFLLA